SGRWISVGRLDPADHGPGGGSARPVLRRFHYSADPVEVAMKRHVKLSVEQLQERNMPSGVSAAGAILQSETGRPIEEDRVPLASLVHRDASVGFVTAGSVRFIAESNEAPPTVLLSQGQAIGFLRPGATRYFGESND